MKQNHNISDPTYDNTSQLYDYVYAFFYGFVQSINYTYDEYTIKIGELLSFTKYTYDASGTADQFIQYMPLRPTQGIAYGEQFIDQRSTGHDIRFKFTGKERDAETGFDYTSTTFSTGFGARYYDSDISVWLSVDPLADKYPSMSAYMYVAGNPVLFVDPDGKRIILDELYRTNDKGEYLHRNGVRQFEAFAKTKMGKFILGLFAEKGQEIAGHKYKKDGYFHKNKIDLVLVGNKDLTKDARDGETSENTSNGRIKVNRLQLGIIWEENINGDVNSVETIGHEILVHAFQYSYDFIDDGVLNNSNINKRIKKFGDKNNYDTGNFQHFQERDFDKRLQKYLVPLLIEYQNSHGIKRTYDETFKFVYDFTN